MLPALAAELGGVPSLGSRHPSSRDHLESPLGAEGTGGLGSERSVRLVTRCHVTARKK